MMQDVAMYQLKDLEFNSLLEKAEIQNRLEGLYEQINEPQKIQNVLLNMYENFERLCYQLHRINKISVAELKAMSVYDFMNYGKFVKEDIKRGKRD